MSRFTDPLPMPGSRTSKVRPRTSKMYDEGDMDLMKMVYKNKGKFHDLSRPSHEERMEGRRRRR